MRPARDLLRPLAVATLALALLVGATACDGGGRAAPPGPSGGGLWISVAEVRARPTSGPAWAKVRAAALADWGPVDLGDLNSRHDTSTLAGALVAVRTGDMRLTARVRAALAEVSRQVRFGRVLELARSIPAYVIAADLVGLGGTTRPAFRAFLSSVRTRPLQGHSGGDSLLATALRSPSNWGTMARAAMVAIDLYLGDRDQLRTVAAAHRAYLGDSAPNQLVYSSTRWHADARHRAGVNRRGTAIAGLRVDGVLPEDQRRTGEPSGPTAARGSYPWEALQGAVLAGVLLDRAGVVPFSAGDDALRRAMTWLGGANGNAAEGDDLWIPWVVNRVRGTSFRTEATRSPGKNMAWTDWTHAPA